MSKIVLTNLADLQNETTAVAAINANNATITSAFNNTLSLDGTAPNTMGANFDMNSHQILNSGTSSYVFANLPSPPVKGMTATLTDGPTGLSWGGTTSGGHSTPYLVWYNGTAWTVIGK